MATEAQTAANRRNARLSTGPRSSTGRARSSMNACKSGIYAQSEIIPLEDPGELAALTTQYYDSIQPQGLETGLVDAAIRADWQLRRLSRAESEAWTGSMEIDLQNNRHKTIHLRAVADNQQHFDRIYRLQASTARTLRASLETLVRLRKNASILLPPPQPEEIDETNPIPIPAAPALSAAGADPTPVAEIDETNPISEPVAPATPVADPPALEPQTRETNPIAPAAALAPGSRPPAPFSRPRFRYYNGRPVPITETPKS